MGRGKVEIKRIENPTSRQVTFSKRRGGLMKKAHELAVLCDVQLGLVVFSGSGKMFQYSNPSNSMMQIIERYQRATNTSIHPYDAHEEQLQRESELHRLAQENEKLLNSIKQYTGEDMSGLTMTDLDQLEEQLGFALEKVRNRKAQLFRQQVDNLRRKTQILEDENRHYREVLEHERQPVLNPHQYEGKLLNGSLGPLLDGPYHQLFPVEDQREHFLPLSDLRLQPPSLHDTGLQPHYLQLG